MNKHHKSLIGILLAALVLCFGLAFAGCDNGGGPNGELGISPSSATYVGGSGTDLRFEVTLGDEEITALLCGGTEVAAENWTVEESALVLKASWLETLAAGTYPMTAKTAKSELSFTVICFKQATVTPKTGEFDWNDPQDLVFKVDLGGATLLGVTVGDTTLTAAQYTFENGSLTIGKDVIDTACNDGDNACKITTSVGDIDFVIHCFSSVVAAKFDAEAYKVQSSPDDDIVFTFDAAGQTYTVERYNEATEVWAETEDAEYSPSEHTLTVSGDILSEEHAGIVRYRVSVEDEENSVFPFAVGAYGKEGEAQLVKASKEVMNNFDSLADGSNFGGTITTFDTTNTFYTTTVGTTNEVISGEHAIEGHSLAITSITAQAQWNILFGVNFGSAAGTTYRVKMDLKLLTAGDARTPHLVFRLFGSNGSETDELRLSYDNSADEFVKVSGIDERSTFSYNKDTEVLTAEVYVTPTEAGQHFRLTFVDGGTGTVVLDNFSILRTDLPASVTMPTGSVQYSKQEGEDKAVSLAIPKGMTFTSASCGEDALTEAQYSFENGTLTLKNSWLQTLGVGDHDVELTFTYVKDLYGATDTATATVKVTVYTAALPSLTSALTQKQTTAKEALQYEFDLGGYTFADISENGTKLDASAYTFEGSKLTLKAEYLNALFAGLHLYEARFTAAEEEFTLKLGAAVYGTTATADGPFGAIQTEDTFGVVNFNDYAVGTSVEDIPIDALSTYKTQDPPKIVEDDVLGNALAITESGGGVISIDDLPRDIGHIMNDNVARPYIYVVRMVFRTENDEAVKSLLWKWDCQGNGGDSVNSAWYRNGGMDRVINNEVRSTMVQREDGAFVWTSYLSAPKVDGCHLILYVVEAQRLNIASVELFKTSFPAVEEPDYQYLDINTSGFVKTSTITTTNTSADLQLALHINGENKKGFNDFRLKVQDTILERGKDYELRGNALWLKASYLTGIGAGESVTFTPERGAPLIDGTYWQPATIIVTVLERATDRTAKLQKQTSEKEALVWELETEGYTLDSVTSGGEAVASDKYEYSAAEKTFTLKAEYLNTLTLGLHKYRLTFKADSKEDLIIDLSASVYGDEKAHTEGTIGVVDFNTFAPGAVNKDITGTGLSYWSGTPEIVTDEILGNSLAITSRGAGLLSIKTLSGDKYYIVRMIFRPTDGQPIKNILFKWNAKEGARDACTVANDAIVMSGSARDVRSTIEKREDGSYVWIAYVGSIASADRDLILWINDGTQAPIHIASFELYEADLKLAAEVTYKHADYTMGGTFVERSTVVTASADKDLRIAQNVNVPASGGFTEFCVMKDGAALTDADYERKSNDELWLKASYLAGIGAGETVTLTLQRGAKRIDGTIYWESSTIDVRVVDGTNPMQKQGADKGDLFWTVTSEGYTLSTVELGEQTVDAGNYSYDAASGLFTLKADYLNGLTAGLHVFKLTMTSEGQENRTVELSASVYGNDTVHTESTIGVVNFNYFEVGAVEKDITGTGIEYWSGTPTIEKDDVLGNTLAINANGPGVLALKKLSAEKFYIVRMVFRTENDEPVKGLLLKWNHASAGFDASWIKNGAMDRSVGDSARDIRCSIEQLDNNAYVWTAYVAGMKAADSELILWGTEAQKLNIASFELFESAVDRCTQGSYNYMKPDDTKVEFGNNETVQVTDVTQDVYVSRHTNAEAKNGFNAFRILQEQTELQLGVDYELRGNAVWIKAAYLTKFEGSVVLTFQRGAPLVDGTELWQSATLTLVKA